VDAKDMMNIIKTDIKNLFDIAPLIDQDVIEAFQKKYGKQVANEPGKYTFDAHTPNLCNGLSIVTVNSARNKQDYEERSSRKSSRDGSPSRDNAMNNNGITVVIDNASIANEIQQQQQQQQQRLEHPHNMVHLNQQLQQLQELQQIQDMNGFRASADIVTIQSAQRGTPSAVRTSSASLTPSAVRTSSAALTPSAVRTSAAPSVQHSAPPSVHHSAPPSVQHSAPPSVQHSAPHTPSAVRTSAAPSVQHSAPHTPSAVRTSAPHSTPNSVHGDASPHESIAIDVHDVPNETPGLQLTQEQVLELQHLQYLQQQMMQDLDGEDGEMM
jgi:hypothetical protein